VSKEIGLDKLILQHTAMPGNRCRRIVAQEKVAGSSPVGHPLNFCIGKGAGEDPPVVELDHAHAEWVRMLLALT
jgi:hypothetical protein